MLMRAIAVAAALVWSVAGAAPQPSTQPGTRAGIQPRIQPANQPGKLLAAPSISAAEVVQKNVAARGGLEAWRRIETMAWSGRVESGAGSGPTLPFLLDLKRPNKTRFEITASEKRFARIFDGTRGWRVRPGNNGAPDVKAFSNEEVAYSRDEFVIDGPLIDYEAKGVALKLAGIDEVEGRKAYLLEVQHSSGANRRVWIDTETFLEVRSDRPSTNPLIKGAPISMYYRDYRTIDGLQIPMTIETRGSATSPPQKIMIDKVALNPQLPGQAFAKPAVPWQRHAIVRVGDQPQGAGRPGP
jgi:outer membrane lipoprotein-sorting protein